MMHLYFAPLEGLTDVLYRRVHAQTFPGVQKYFMPFISPAHSLHFTAREMFDLSPAQNAGVPAVPQVLAKDPEYFLGTVSLLQESGYGEVNLNIGCPSGTVTAKGKGAGMLKSPENLDRFLDAVFARSPLPISVKTRVGWEDVREWPALLNVLACYPILALILHPRTCREFYRGAAHRELLEETMDRAPFPVIYNGDIFDAADGQQMIRQHPRLSGLMLGRGLAANPALAREIAGGSPLSRQDVIRFHDRLFREYMKFWPASAAVGRMHAIMGYLGQCFEDGAHALRDVKRAAQPEDYLDAAARFFSQCDLRPNPRFIPPG